MKKVIAVIVAAGEGRRFGGAKQYALLKGKPVLEWTLEKFESHPKVDEIILVLPDVRRKRGFLERYKKIAAVIKGGKHRQDSVRNGVYQIDPQAAGIVLVHDGVRPFVSERLISRVIEATSRRVSVVPGLPIEDTVKRVEGTEVVRTLERARLFRIQTPQGFFYAELKAALDRAVKDRFYATDEAMLVERNGGRVLVVEGDPDNLKITTPRDLKIAEVLIES
jgi:2-C-methyl-D-erythritol 4-phosphate cytidylyltransferase